MLHPLRRLYRRVFPRLTDPWLDEDPRHLPPDDAYEAAYRAELAAEPGRPGESAFLAARYREGMRWRNVLARVLEEPGRSPTARTRVLDLGAGNGAVELALAADPTLRPVSVDRLSNRVGCAVHRRAGVPFRRVVAEAHALPLRSGAFDAIFNLETVEHLELPAEAGRETARVLRPGGSMLLTTPPRWRYALRPDPHFGIRGLVLLPPALQRAVAARRGFADPHHYVHRIYGAAPQIARLFPGCTLGRILSRSRAPRRWIWDALILRKAAPPDTPPSGLREDASTC
jgi:SAM-dependent methyltransferase